MQQEESNLRDTKRPILPKAEVHPPAPSALPVQVSADFFEKRKNEIVSEMLNKIKPFVGGNGMLQPDCDFEKLAKLMEGEVEFLGRTLILTILISSTGEPSKGGDEAKAIVFLLCDRLTRSSAILSVLQRWLTDASKGGEPVCHLALKVLQLLDRLHLTVEHLVQYKYGKLVKRILTREETCVTPETKAKAQILFDKWSELAKTEDNRRRSSASSSTSVKSNVPTAENGAVENVDFFGEANAPKTRSALILERAAKSVTAKVSSSVSTRPMSADDIHKAKKRRQYLQEAVASGQANSEELEQLGIKPVSPPSPPPPTLPIDVSMDIDIPPIQSESTTLKKRVSFANEDELVKVHFFEPYDEEEEDLPSNRKSLQEFRSSKKKKSTDYHHADKQEASYAFKRLQMEMEAEIEWYRPDDILIEDENISPSHGEESTENVTQEVRERQQVSAVYFNIDHIPPSPSEADLSLHNSQDFRAVPSFPLECSSVQKIIITDPSKKPSTIVDPSILSAILGNFLPTPPLRPPMPPPPMFPPPFLTSTGVPPPFPMRPRLPIHGMMPPFMPQSSIGFPTFPLAVQTLPPRPPFPFPFPGASLPRPPMTQPRPNMLDPSQNPKLKTKPCKYYKAGQPGSCRFGASCAFYHQD